MTPLPPEHHAAIQAMADQLATTWNRQDGLAFAALFTEDATFVDIKGNRDDGRTAIGERHVWLFQDVFTATSVAYDVVDTATLAPGLAIGHVRAHVTLPGGRLETLATCLFQHAPGGWRILAWHNTELGQYGA